MVIRRRAILALVFLGSASAGCNAILGTVYDVETHADGSTSKPDATGEGDVAPQEAGGDDVTVEDSPADANDGGSSDAADADSACALDDIHTCGSCTTDCARLTHVGEAGLGCAAGECSYSCAPGYGDCADAGTGCATDFSQLSPPLVPLRSRRERNRRSRRGRSSSGLRGRVRGRTAAWEFGRSMAGGTRRWPPSRRSRSWRRACERLPPLGPRQGIQAIPYARGEVVERVTISRSWHGPAEPVLGIGELALRALMRARSRRCAPSVLDSIAPIS